MRPLLASSDSGLGVLGDPDEDDETIVVIAKTVDAVAALRTD